ncbi:TIGR01777 family protein [Siminovitchia acidinfaciens]|uniref:TIGR01777 family protein n=1 Tax=Siminovitchia acidinfaciens TaxID=2321395 RepID=A0A429Y7S7_9BACI|nr:TIGR01777 family oxidoreductase [Siminovitchia acidinfaciens]RST77443.1 TIGR01777 family protein [Siminovitchia acidinfaciens]
MHVVIAGGSGFVGQVLQEKLLSEESRVTILTRNPENIRQTDRLRAVEWLKENSHPEKEMGNVDAIVNLAGESINGLRWTKQKKERILQSRMEATGEIIKLIDKLERKPQVLINASAVGYYGMSDTEVFTEKSPSDANDFLADTVQKWERKASEASRYGVRTVFARFGIILGREGALPLMALPYKVGIGGTIGTGRQWVSWIHVDDAAKMIKFAIDTHAIEGPLNVTAPTPVMMKEFGKVLGSVLRKPHWLPVPETALKVILGEMSSMIIRGQRVLPEKAKVHHYEYLFPELESALKDIFLKTKITSS